MRLNGSSWIARLAFLIATVVVLTNVPVRAQKIVPGEPSSATPLAPTTIIQDTAVPALPPSLEQEARSEIAALRGISDDTFNDYWSRGEILAYMLLRVLQVAYKPPSQYTPEEQEIANYFNVWIYADNVQTVEMATKLYNNFSSNPCGFTLPAGIGTDNGQDYLQEDGVTSFCNTPLPPPILGTFVYTPVPPASQFWSWAQAIVLNQHLNDWGNRLFNPYVNYYDPSGNMTISVSSYGPGASTAGQAAAVEYFGALQDIDEGTAFLVNQYTQIPSSGASTAAIALQKVSGVDLDIDLLDHGLREIISSDISTASEEVYTATEIADAFELGVDLTPELSELALQGAELGIGPIMIAGAITGLNLEQIIGDSSVPSDLANMSKCALFVACGNTPATLSDYAQTVPNGRQMILQALVRAVMPTYSLVRYADPVFGQPPSTGPYLPSDPTFLVNNSPNPTGSFIYSDWNNNLFQASVVGGWLARQLQFKDPNSPVTPPTTLQYAPGIEYTTSTGELWFAWLNNFSFYAQRVALPVGYGTVTSCPGGVIGPNGSGTSNGVCVQTPIPKVPLQAGDQISIGGQVNSVANIYQPPGSYYIQPANAFPTSSKALPVLLLAQPIGQQPATNCLNSSSLNINGSPRPGVNGPDCTTGIIATNYSGNIQIVQPTAQASFNLQNVSTNYYGDAPFSVAALPFWSSTSNGAVTYTLATGSVGCSVTSDGTVTITGLGTCRITATQAATNVFIAPPPITSSFTITAGQPAIDIIAPAILSGNPATVTVAVYGAGGGTATGSVSLLVDGTTVGTQTLSGGFATFTLAKPALGSHTLQANFTGNPAVDFLANSAAVTLEVDPNFGTVAVGATPPVRIINYSFTGPTLLSAINILTEGISGLDYSDYGGDTCRVGTSYTTGQSCTVKVQFSPSAAGARPGAVILFAQGATKPLFTAYLNGIGQAGAVTIDPGAESNLYGVPDQQGVATDGAGGVYLVNGNQVTKLVTGRNPATVASGLPSPKAVAVDGAGNVYISDTKNNNVIMVPNENGKLNSADQSVMLSSIGTPTGLAVDVNGNLYVSDSTTGNVWQVAAGTGATLPLISGLNAPQAVAVDAKLNIYVSTSDNLVTEYPAGYQPGGAIQPVALGSGYLNPQGIAVDSSGTVYVADSGNVQIVKVAPGGASQSILPFGGPQFGNYPSGPKSLALDSANNLYVIDPNTGLVKINRTQPPSLVFFAVVNTTSPTQTLTVTDAGNQQLNILSDSLPANFVTQPSGGTDCAVGTVLSPGGQCLLDVAFSPTPSGNLTGNMTVTENGVGSTTQSVALSGNILQAQTITFTTPPPAQTPNDVTGAFNVAATASSGLPITFTSAGVCTNYGTLYLMTGATGTCSVIATQAGNATYGPASVTVVTNVLLDSHVYFTSLPSVEVLYNTSFNASATGVSSVPITFSASGACTYVSETNSGAVYTARFTMTGSTGTCTMTANQAAGNGYVGSSASATAVPIQGQTIIFTQKAPARATYDQSFTVAATASSGLPVTFTSSGVCTNSGAAFTITGSSGTCWVIANQAGNSNYFPATTVTETVTAASDPTLNFGKVPVRTTFLKTLTYTFTSTATLSAINVLTAGASGLDYTLNSASTCTVGTSYNPGNTCTVEVAFKPTAAGARPGAVTLFAQGTNLPLLTEYLSGVGNAAEVTIDPGTKTTLGTMAGGQADGSAMDGAGNVYVADYWDNQIVKIAAGTKTQTAVVTGLTGPVWVALDGAGNLYISQVGSTGYNGSLFKVPNENGTLNTADMTTLTYSGLSSPHGLATDVSGNLYVAEYGSGTISVVPSGDVTGSTLLSGINTPYGVAVDSGKNVYVSSYLGNTVTEYPAFCLSQPASCPVPVGSGYNGPQGIAVDAAGNIYVADSGNRRIELVPNPEAGEFPGAIQQSTVVAGLGAPVAVTVAPSGNLLVSDNANLFDVNRTTHLPTLTFPGVAIESGASSPPKTVTLTDVGNEPLNFTGGSIDPDFPPSPSDFCNYEVEPGAQCSISIVFSPQGGSLGTRTGTWAVTDNAITGGGTQSWTVTGPAWMGQYISFAVNAPTSAKPGKKYAFQVEAEACAQFGGCSTHVAVSFSGTGVCTHTPATLVDPVNGIYASTYTMTSGIGSCSVIASAPAAPTDNYAAASATEVVIASQFAQTITFAQPPNQSLSAVTYTLTATASSGLPVTFTSHTTGVCTVSGNTATLLTTGTCTIEAQQPGNDDWLPVKPVIRSFQVTE
jgi:sugar lactone lactonase YvrE